MEDLQVMLKIKYLNKIDKSIHFGRIYILAPEGACNNNASVANLGLFEEVWQYGSDYARTDLQPSQPLLKQDFIAPQCDIPDINKKTYIKQGGRVFYPEKWTPQDPYHSHIEGNFGWIFTRTQTQTGYVKPRK
jgi:phage pi2 protein 07